MGQRWAATPPPTGPPPVYPVIVDSPDPKRPIREHPPPVYPTEDAALESTTCVSLNFRDVEGSQPGQSVGAPPCGVDSHDSGRVAVSAAVGTGQRKQVQVEISGLVTRAG